LLVLFIEFSFVYVSLSKDIKPELLANIPHINGFYKKCIVYNYKFKFGEIDLKTKIKKIINNYNDDGLLIESINYNEKSTKSDKAIYKYKFDNTISIYECTFYDNKGVLFTKEITEFKYDENGNLIENCDAYNSSGKRKYIRKYDKNNNIIESSFYWEDGGTIYNDKYDYYKNENKKIINSYANGINFEREICKLNDSGKIIEQINYKLDTQNKMIQECQIMCKYDINGQIIEQVEYKFDSQGISNQNSHITYKYDQFGNVIEEIYYDYMNEPIDKTEYIYSK
jgi:hypothetical protein